MHNDLNTLEASFREVAFDAGRVLLGHADEGSLTTCVIRYHDLCTRLRRIQPALQGGCRTLPKEATPGHVRLAARDAAFRIRRFLAAASFRIQCCAA